MNKAALKHPGTNKAGLKHGEQTKLATLIGIHPVHLNAILCGRRRPSARMAMRIQEGSGGLIKAWDLLFPDKTKGGASAQKQTGQSQCGSHNNISP